MLGPWQSGEPETPGIYLTRGEDETWDWWRLWDGTHWSRGQLTQVLAVIVYGRLLQSGAMMRREQRSEQNVTRWRTVI